MENVTMLCLEKGLHLILIMHFIQLQKGLINSFKEINDHEEFKLAVIVNFGIDTTITAEELDKEDVNL